MQKHTEPVQKITIIPRTSGALGYVLQTPEEEKFLLSKNEILARLVVCMGGRAAEEVVFNSITTGASNDIQQATNLARAMVTQYGMSDKFGLMGLESRESMYLDNGSVLNCSDETASHVDEEVMRILKEAYDEAKQLLTENRECLDKIAEFLIEKETITGKEFMKIYRAEKGIPEPEEKEESKLQQETEKQEAEQNEAKEKEAEPLQQEPEIQEREEKPVSEAPRGRFSGTSTDIFQ